MFLGIVALFSISAQSIAGGWESIPINDSSLKIVEPWLLRNIPLLFPEIGSNSFEIVSAKTQIVSGRNFELNIKSKSVALLFKIRLYVNLTDYVRIEMIQRPIGSRPLFGGYRWQKPERFTNTQLLSFIRTIQEQSNLLVGQPGSVLMYRTKIVKGLITHVVFRDSNDKVFSTVMLRNPLSNRLQLVSVYQIF